MAFSQRFGTATAILLIHLFVLSFVVVPLLLARMTGRLRLTLLCGVLVVVGAFATEQVNRFLGALGQGTLWGVFHFQVRDLIAFGLAVPIALSLAMAVRWVYRVFRFTPIEQTVPPRMCYACGYEAGASDPCPECGTRREDARQRGVALDSAWRLLQRSGRPAMVIVLLLLSMYAGYRIASEYVPARRFIASFSDGFRPVYTMHEFAFQADPNDPTAWHSNGRTFPLDGDSGRMILVTYRARTRGGVPVMHVRICAPATPAPGWSGRIEDWTDWGTPGTVVADLNRE